VDTRGQRQDGTGCRSCAPAAGRAAAGDKSRKTVRVADAPQCGMIGVTVDDISISVGTLSQSVPFASDEARCRRGSGAEDTALLFRRRVQTARRAREVAQFARS
jgi:hypothetical protein